MDAKTQKDYRRLLLELQRDTRDFLDECNTKIDKRIRQFEQDAASFFEKAEDEQQEQTTKIVEVAKASNEPEIMTRAQVAKFLGISMPTVRKYNVPCTRLPGGKTVLYRRSEVLAWMNRIQVYGKNARIKAE